MSWKFADLLCDYELTPTEHLVMIYLARRAHPDGSKSYPSVARLVWETRLSERTVQRVMRRLVARGVLVRTEGPGFHKPTTYRLVLSRLARKAPFVTLVHKGATVTPITPAEKGANDAEKGANDAEKGAKAWHPIRPLERSFETRAENPRSGRFDQLCAYADCDERGYGAHSLCVQHLGLKPKRDFARVEAG